MHSYGSKADPAAILGEPDRVGCRALVLVLNSGAIANIPGPPACILARKLGMQSNGGVMRGNQVHALLSNSPG